MYTGDHIVISAAVAALVSRRFSLKYIPLALLFILTNLIDLDHLVYYNLDNGTLNSLTLHPLHLYASVVITFIFFAAILDPKRLAVYFAAVVAIALHLTMDALAYQLGYQINLLLIWSIIQFAIVYIILKKCTTKGSYQKLFFFLIIQWLVISMSQYILSFFLAANESRIVYLMPQILTILSAGTFWLIFRNKIEMRK